MTCSLGAVPGTKPQPVGVCTPYSTGLIPSCYHLFTFIEWLCEIFDFRKKKQLPRCLPWFSQLLISTATVEVLDLLSPSTRRCGRCTFFPCACAGRTGAGRKDMVLQATASTTPKQTCIFFHIVRDLIIFTEST